MYYAIIIKVTQVGTNQLIENVLEVKPKSQSRLDKEQAKEKAMQKITHIIDHGVLDFNDKEHQLFFPPHRIHQVELEEIYEKPQQCDVESYE